jgi:hypothetical protein
MPKKAKRLTPRQNRFLKAMAKGKTQAQAAVQAGYSKKNAHQSGYQAAQLIRRNMPEVMERHGLTDDALIDNYLLPALQAEETQFIVTGGVKKPRIHAKKHPVWEPRLRALDMSFKLKGSYAPLQMEQAHRTVTTIILDIPRPPRPGNGAKPIDVEPTSSKGNGTGQD